MSTPWDQVTYRRCLVDCHFPDWDPALLSNFSGEDFVLTMKQAGQQAVMFFANSHSGQCFWDTSVGPRHKNMGERDFFREVEAACQKHGMLLRVYYSIIFDSWNYEHHPDWRMVPLGSREDYEKGRYGHCCPNSQDYRNYVRACMDELVGQYDAVDVFFDMLFWPMVCYCDHCRARYRDEVGGDMPVEMDWDASPWRNLQAARQRWLTEFAFWCRDSVKRVKPNVTVSFNNANTLSNWSNGVSLQVRDAADYLFGDFYGGPTQHAFACKLYHSLRPDRPDEYATFVSESYNEHVSAKSEDQLRIDIGMALIHHGAMMQIDGFITDGTLNPKVYERLARLNADRPVYEEYLGGRLTADVAIYVDRESFYHPSRRGDSGPHHKAIFAVAEAMQEAHIPFAIVTSENIEEVSRYRAVIASAVQEMTAEQSEVLRDFVKQGGVLYASGTTSLDRFASPGPRYLLENVFGVRYVGRFPYNVNYLDPSDDVLLTVLDPQEYLTLNTPVCRVETMTGAQCLATIRPTYVDPDAGRMIGQTFATIHSNPPAAKTTNSPALVINKFGKGACVWSATAFETCPHCSSRRLLAHLIRRVLPGPYSFEAKAPVRTEITLFNQPDKNRQVVGLLHQVPMPCPVGAALRVHLSHKWSAPARVLLLPSKQELSFVVRDGCVEFSVPEFEVMGMVVIEYSIGHGNC